MLPQAMPPMQPPPQSPNQNMGAFLQQAAGGSPQMGQPPMQGGGMPQGMQQPQQGPQGPQQGPQQGQINPKFQQLIQQLASAGRYGDTTVAHLTPGEVTIPPQVQTPQLMKNVDKAFASKGSDISHFTVGSPQSSINPATGMAEYNFWSSFLPSALGLAGGFLFPPLMGAVAPELMASLGGIGAASLGSGLGTTIGGLAGGHDPMNAIATGALSGLGSYAGGSLLGAGSGAADSASKIGGIADSLKSPAEQVAADVAREGAGSGAAAASSSPTMMQRLGMAGGGMLGGSLGSSIFPDQVKAGAALPPGFTNHMPAPNSVGSYSQLLGQPNYNGPQASFSSYNPLSTNPSQSTGYNFFPIGG